MKTPPNKFPLWLRRAVYVGGSAALFAGALKLYIVVYAPQVASVEHRAFVTNVCIPMSALAGAFAGALVAFLTDRLAYREAEVQAWVNWAETARPTEYSYPDLKLNQDEARAVQTQTAPRMVAAAH